MSYSVDRRRFLATSSTLAAAASICPSALGSDDDTEDDYYGGFPMGIQSYSLRNFNIHEAIRHTEGLGLKYMELYSSHLALNSDEETIDALLKTMADAGITMNAHGVNGFSSNHEANRRVFEFAHRAGICNISANPQPDSFDSLDRLVDEFDIRIAIHNHGPGALFDKLESVLTAIEDHDRRIGACIDTGHVLRSDEDPLQWIRELEGRTYGMHIKDVAARTSRTHSVVIGTGHLDVDGLFATIKEIGFPSDGAMSMEYESNPQNPVDDIAQSLAVAKEAITKLE